MALRYFQSETEIEKTFIATQIVTTTLGDSQTSKATTPTVPSQIIIIIKNKNNGTSAFVHISRYHLAGLLLHPMPRPVGRVNSSRPSEGKEGGGLPGLSGKGRGSYGETACKRAIYKNLDWTQTHRIGRDRKRSSGQTIPVQGTIPHTIPNDCLTFVPVMEHP